MHIYKVKLSWHDPSDDTQHILVQADYYTPNAGGVNFYKNSQVTDNQGRSWDTKQDELIASYYNVTSVVLEQPKLTNLEALAGLGGIVSYAAQNAMNRRLIDQGETLSLKDRKGRTLNETKVTRKK